MATGITVVDQEVRKMWRDLRKEITGAKSNKHIKRFVAYKKEEQVLPFAEGGIRNENGSLKKWDELSDVTFRQKYMKDIIQRMVYRSPYGKPIQAPWNPAGYMDKVKFNDKVAHRRAGRVLIRTGRLLNGLTIRKDFRGGKSEFVQSTAPGVVDPNTGYRYAWVHFFGAKRSGVKVLRPHWDPTSKKYVEDKTSVWNYRIPARPFLSWTKKDLEMLEKFLLAWVAEKSK